jgi:hypothetical protein
MVGTAAGATAGAGAGAGTASAGAGAGTSAIGSAGTGSASAGSASAVGVLNINAATNPSAVTAVALLSIFTDAPSHYRLEPVLLGASASQSKLLHLWLL